MNKKKEILKEHIKLNNNNCQKYNISEVRQIFDCALIKLYKL